MTQLKGTIFIMDDDLALQTVLELALRDAGYEVAMANDGIDGLEKLQTLKPNLVISDVMMPNMDGVEVFQRIKDQLQDSGTPIIIMTALNRKAWFADLEAEGAVIIHKPFEIDYLLNLVESALA
jgi:DNA-binding response OmpR family regulator